MEGRLGEETRGHHASFFEIEKHSLSALSVMHEK